jgi:hypothetical protein
MRRDRSSAIIGLLQAARERVLLLAAVALLFSIPTAAQVTVNFTDISSQVGMIRSGLILNRSTNTFDSLVTLTNRSAAALAGPLVVTVSNIGQASVTLSNSGGQDSSGNFYVNVTLPAGTLAPGQSVTNILLEFSDPNQVSFTFTTTVEQVSVPGGDTTVANATGATINVPDPQNPSSSVTIAIPAGYLNTPFDAISVSFSDTPPGPLNPNAVAAGARFVSRVVTLTRVSGLKFKLPIQVTIPYVLSEAGPNYFVMTVYWDTTENNYDVVETVNNDTVNGNITFQTIHFSQYTAIAWSFSLAPGTLPTDPDILSHATGFSPAVDGFPIKNFSTLTGAATGGACFGLTAFAKWFFQSRSVEPELALQAPLATNPIVNTMFTNQSGELANGNAAEDDVAREIIYWGYDETEKINETSAAALNLKSKSDLSSATDLFWSLLLTNEPQLLTLAENGSYQSPSLEALHSVLVYSYNIDTTSNVVNFSFYDPNVPCYNPMTPCEQTLTYHINAMSFSLPAYCDAYSTCYSWAYFTALSSVMAPFDFLPAFENAVNGWPDRHFNEITIDQSGSTALTLISQQGANPVTTPAEYQVAPGLTTFQMSWNCSCPPAGQNNTAYAHIFINGAWQAPDIPIQVSSTSQLLGLATPFSYTLPSNAGIGGASTEMIVIVSGYQMNTLVVPPNIDPIDRLLSAGYEGFLRIKLALPLYQITMLGIESTANANDVIQETSIGCFQPSQLSYWAPLYKGPTPAPISANIPLSCVGFINTNNPLQATLAPINPLPSDSVASAFSPGGPGIGPVSATAQTSLLVTPTEVALTYYGFGTNLQGGGGGVFSASVGVTLEILRPAQYQIVATVPNGPAYCVQPPGTTVTSGTVSSPPTTISGPPGFYCGFGALNFGTIGLSGSATWSITITPTQ